MNNKKYQVFISSTYYDLIEERRKILDTLLKADCIPAGMEAFVATDAEQFEVIKKVIDLCDYYVLIIGKRYGSTSSDTNISYTEMEYDYAIEKGIPVLVFALDDSVDLPPEKTESDIIKIEQLKKFREKAMTNRLATIWRSDSDLTGGLAVSIMNAKNEMKRPGWQRAVDFDEASLRREIMELQSNNANLCRQIEEQQKTIDLLTQQSDLAFDDCDITIDYHYFTHDSRNNSHRVDKTMVVKLTEIFRIISLEMADVCVREKSIELALKLQLFKNIRKSVDFSDSQFVKSMLNQFKSLNLLYSKLDPHNHFLYWGLTTKGNKIKNDMTLIRNTV